MRLKPVKARSKKGRLNITDDLIPFFLDNYGPICEIWKYFLSARATACNAKARQRYRSGIGRYQMSIREYCSWHHNEHSNCSTCTVVALSVRREDLLACS
jgi:hypothetical protein